MAVNFKAKVIGDTPAHRLMWLTVADGEENAIGISLPSVGENYHKKYFGADFVSTGSLSDGDMINVNLMSGVRIWEIEAGEDIRAGIWVVSDLEGRVVDIAAGAEDKNRSTTTVGIILESVKQGEVAKVVRREIPNNMWGSDTELRLNALEAQGVSTMSATTKKKTTTKKTSE